MNILALSGWGQPYNALSSVVPEATHVDYAHYNDIDTALSHIKDTYRGHDVIVGWSLGGQLAVRAIAKGLIAPKKLILIATPFEFVEVAKSGVGMKRDTFDKFYGNFARDPLRTLNKAWELVLMDDAHADMVRNQLATFSKDAVLAHNWLKWLALIDGFSCESLDFSRFPSTMLIHGDKDVVVEPEQSKRFAARIPDARLITWQDCGHAPHWHDKDSLKQLIAEHAGV